MRKISDKEKQLKKLGKIVGTLGWLTLVVIGVFLIYLAIAIKVYETSILFLAVGLPIGICLFFFACFGLRHFVKKEEALKTELYGKETELLADSLSEANPLFTKIVCDYKEFIGEESDNQFDRLYKNLPKGWKVVDFFARNNTIFIDIRKKKTDFGVEIEISDTEIVITWEDAQTEEEFSEHKKLSSENFENCDKIWDFIYEVCGKIDANMQNKKVGRE